MELGKKVTEKNILSGKETELFSLQEGKEKRGTLMKVTANQIELRWFII